MSKIVQKDATMRNFITFLQTALHVSGDTFTHHQEITASGIGRTVLATFRCREGVPSPPGQRKVANTVRSVPDAVITVYVCS